MIKIPTHNSPAPFTAVVLAADRGAKDPLVEAAGVRCKSMIPVGGTPMVLRVLATLAASPQIHARILCGPPRSILEQEPDLRKLIASGKVGWSENQTTPSSSALHVLESLTDAPPLLLTTADHALLNTCIVDYFCSRARATDCDVVVGVALHETVTSAYPETRRTAVHLQDGAYCGCNLFAFLTPQARLAANYWRHVETRRKKPLRMIAVLGWATVLRYLLGRLSLAEALGRISQRMGIKAGAVVLPFPEAAIDVDSPSDWQLVEKIVSDRQR